MLIRFTVENYLSFKKPATLNMVKSRERQMPDHVCDYGVSGYKLLRGAIVYGANAAGKSNLIHSMKTARDFIVNGTEIPQHKAFRLSPGNEILPSSFDFEFVVDGNSFAYGFEVLKGTVNKEWLYETKYKKEDILIFSRSLMDGDTQVDFGGKMKGVSTNSAAIKSLGDLVETAPVDKLALTDLIKRNVASLIGEDLMTYFHTVFDWFVEKLDVRKVGDKADPYDLERYFEMNDSKFKEEIGKVLKLADTGIDRIDLLEYEGELRALFPMEDLVERLYALENDQRLFIQLKRRRFLATMLDGELSISRLIVIRKDTAGKEKVFELNEESDGTRRIIDLASLFLRENNFNVIVIDEMDRSLHPAVTKMFHDLHYKKHTTSQLIIASHEHYLLSQEHYRRDEIWFVNKNKDGNSELYSLSEYDAGVRFDKDIRKDYLLGRYGAVPNIGV